MYTSLEQSTNSLLKENLMRGNTDKDEKVNSIYIYIYIGQIYIFPKQGGRDVVTHRGKNQPSKQLKHAGAYINFPNRYNGLPKQKNRGRDGAGISLIQEPLRFTCI